MNVSPKANDVAQLRGADPGLGSVVSTVVTPPVAGLVDTLERTPIPADKLAMLRTIITRAAAPNRSQVAFDLFTTALELTNDLAKHVGVLVWAAGTTRDLPDTEGLVPPTSGFLALKTVAALPAPVRAEVERILASAEAPGERAVILKAIGAHAGDADLAPLLPALERLAATIRGKELLWLIRETTAYDLDGDVGERQVYTTACGPTVALTIGAELDPLLDLALELDTTRGVDSLSARLQRDMLETHGGVAVTYGDTTRDGVAVPLGDMVAKAVEHAGISYTGMAWAELGDSERQSLLDELDVMVRRGADVALLSHDGIGAGHYEALVDTSMVQGKRAWRIQDPEGNTRWVSDRAMVTRDIGVLGMELTTLWFPS